MNQPKPLYDVEVFNGHGWSTDLTTGSKRYAQDRAHELRRRGLSVRLVRNGRP